MNKAIKKYIRLYAKHMLLLMCVITIPLFLLFFIVSFFADAQPYDLQFSFVILGAGGIVFIATLYPIKRFCAMIKHQEKQFGVVFSDKDSRKIGENVEYLTDEWLINAGTIALYWKNIKGISSKVARTNGRAGMQKAYSMKITTMDDSVYIFNTTSEHVESLIRIWLSNLYKKNKDI